MKTLQFWITTVFACWLTTVVVYSQTTYEAYYFNLFAGTVGTIGAQDGTGAAAQFNSPVGMALDTNGNVYIADSGNFTIRKISPAGAVMTIAGSAGNFGTTDGIGTQARFTLPQGLGIDSAGNLYVGDSQNHTIRKVTPGGAVSTFAGAAGQSGSADGTGSAARFFYPIGIAVDASNNIYVADNGNYTIRMITPGGVVTTLAGLAGNAGAADGAGNMARFYFPTRLAYDSAAGVLYVADTGNDTVRKVTLGGAVTTIAGSAGNAGNVDGSGTAALFDSPAGVAVDAASNIFVAASNSHTIRKIHPNGVVTTLAGSPGNSGSTDAVGSNARFNVPRALVADGAGRLYVADTDNQTIRFGVPAAGGLSLSISQHNGQKVIAGHTFPNVSVNISAAGDLGTAYQPLITVTSDTNGLFQYTDNASGRRFYRASLAGS